MEIIVIYQPDFEQLDKLSDEGYLRKVISPCGKLVLYNYTDKCSFEKKWNEHTINSRGTIYEISTGKVVARSFPKFFNYGELSEPFRQLILNQSDFVTFNKYDGSLGIVYFYDNEWRVNTRGSFTSDQAIKAKSLLKDMTYAQKDITYLVEIIYPENKIIVDYGDFEGLIQIGAYHTETGKEVYSSGAYFDDIASTSHFTSIGELIDYVKQLPYSEEGYVVKLKNGDRVKFKGEEYLQIARMISHISPLSIWENMVDGKVDRKFLEGLPEEFREEYEGITIKLENTYSNLIKIIETQWCVLSSVLGSDVDAKSLGLYLKNNPSIYSSAFFELLKGKSVPDKLLMKLIKPSGNKIKDI